MGIRATQGQTHTRASIDQLVRHFVRLLAARGEGHGQRGLTARVACVYVRPTRGQQLLHHCTRQCPEAILQGVV
jgi:hypothetical protein